MITCTQGALGDPGRKPTTFFSGWDFNSMAVINGFAIGANENGLYRLKTTEQDAGVNYTRTFTIATSDYGVQNPKVAEFLYFEFIGSAAFTVSVKMDDGSWEDFTLTPASTGLQRRRLPIGRYDQGGNITFKVSSTSAFKINRIDGLFTVRSHGIIGH